MVMVYQRFEKIKRKHNANKYGFSKRRSTLAQSAKDYDFQTTTQNQTQNQTGTNLTNFEDLRGKMKLEIREARTARELRRGAAGPCL